TLVVVALMVIPYFGVNIQGEPLWGRSRRTRLQIFLGVFVTLFVFLAIYQAWTVLVPSVLVAALAFVPYFQPSSTSRFVRHLMSRTLPWWVMTWFIAVPLALTTVVTFLIGTVGSWVW